MFWRYKTISDCRDNCSVLPSSAVEKEIIRVLAAEKHTSLFFKHTVLYMYSIFAKFSQSLD